MKADRMIEMKHLPEEEGWELFCRGAFVASEVQHMDSEFESVAREIAKECKGHPLAIRTLARAMPELQDSTASEWEHILKQLKEIDPNFYRVHEELLRELFNPLKHSYDALQTDELRHCFLYMAAYREDEEIDADELVQLWLAEGLVKSREDGHHFLKTLENRCLVQIEKKEERGLHIREVKIHDVLRDMAVHVGEVDQNTLFRAGQNLQEFPKNANAATVRVSLMYNCIRSLPETLDCGKLVTLLLSWNAFEQVPEGFLGKLNMLKVLDLSHTPIQSLPNSIHQLNHLVHLQLSSTQIKVIPDQTFEVSTVQFFDLSFSPLKSIPSLIKKLKHLRVLKLAYCYDLEFISCDISLLSGLEELDMWKTTMCALSWEVRERGGLRDIASLQDVCKLHRLKRLRLTLKSPVEERTVGTLVEVEELWLLWMPEVRQTHLPTDMRVMQKLERLHLYDCDIEATPDLFSGLKRLKYLKLYRSQELPTLSGLGLGKLSDLKEIDVEECLLLKELGDDFGSKGLFPKLRTLKLSKLPSLESVCSFVEGGAFPMLQSMIIFRCMNVKVLPWGFHNLKSLKEIRGDKAWWNDISWQDEEMKQHLYAKYVEIVEIRGNNGV